MQRLFVDQYFEKGNKMKLKLLLGAFLASTICGTNLMALERNPNEPTIKFIRNSDRGKQRPLIPDTRVVVPVGETADAGGLADLLRRGVEMIATLGDVGDTPPSITTGVPPFPNPAEEEATLKSALRKLTPPPAVEPVHSLDGHIVTLLPYGPFGSDSRLPDDINTQMATLYKAVETVLSTDSDLKCITTTSSALDAYWDGKITEITAANERLKNPPPAAAGVPAPDHTDARARNDKLITFYTAIKSEMTSHLTLAQKLLMHFGERFKAFDTAEKEYIDLLLKAGSEDLRTRYTKERDTQTSMKALYEGRKLELLGVMRSIYPYTRTGYLHVFTDLGRYAPATTIKIVPVDHPHYDKVWFDALASLLKPATPITPFLAKTLAAKNIRVDKPSSDSVVVDPSAATGTPGK